MTDILTRAARALVKSQSGSDVFDDLEEEAQEAAREHVRAVLVAIREPSAEMVHEAVSEYVGDIDAERTWQAMIDGALSGL